MKRMQEYDKRIGIPDFKGWEEREIKVHKILSLFENGAELYQTNEVFNKCVEHLLRGGDVYRLLEHIVVMHDDLQKRFTQLIESGKIRQEIVVTKDRFEEIKSL